MPTEATNGGLVRLSVRSGPYQYVRVRPDGSSATIPVSHAALAAGSADVDVGPGDRIVEVALSSTSDPDLDAARGQLWPPEVA